MKKKLLKKIKLNAKLTESQMVNIKGGMMATCTNGTTYVNTTWGGCPSDQCDRSVVNILAPI